MRLLEQAIRLIPSASQTYSKGYHYYCEGAAPVFVDHARGSRLWDVDGNEFIDTVMGLGAVTIGYNDERVNQTISKQLGKGISFTLPSVLEAQLAEKLVSIIPCAEQVRFVKNGSDATTAAIRLARAYTGRDIVLCCGYHGWHDWSIGVTENNRGVPKAVSALTFPFRYHDIPGLESLLEEHQGQVAAIILEPVQLTTPQEDYLNKVRQLADQHGSVLIFDEVVSGFRFSLSGAQGYFGVKPDLACFGKGMANGAPLACLVGRKEIMQLIEAGVFVSMTFGGETLSLAAALKTIEILSEADSFPYLWKIQRQWAKGVSELIKGFQLEKMVFCSAFPAIPTLQFASWDLQSYFQQEAIAEGILYLGPHNFCLAHSPADMEAILKAYSVAFEKIAKALKANNLANSFRGGRMRPIFKRRDH